MLKKAVDITLSIRMAEREVYKFSGEVTERTNKISFHCFWCGKCNHHVDLCFHKKSHLGHLSKMCRNKQQGKPNNQKHEYGACLLSVLPLGRSLAPISSIPIYPLLSSSFPYMSVYPSIHPAFLFSFFL